MRIYHLLFHFFFLSWRKTPISIPRKTTNKTMRGNRLVPQCTRKVPCLLCSVFCIEDSPALFRVTPSKITHTHTQRPSSVFLWGTVWAPLRYNTYFVKREYQQVGWTDVVNMEGPVPLPAGSVSQWGVLWSCMYGLWTTVSIFANRRRRVSTDPHDKQYTYIYTEFLLFWGKCTSTVTIEISYHILPRTYLHM